MVKLADAPDLGSGAARRSGSSPLGGTTSPQSEPCKPLGICPRALLYRLLSRAVDPALGHGIARILAIPKFGRMPKPHRGCRQNIHPHPLFPQIFCCAKYLREPYFFICKANFVSPWAFAQGLYSIACPLAQSILRSVTELPAYWQFRSSGVCRNPTGVVGIRPHPFSPKSFAAQNICGSPFYFSATEALAPSRFRSTDTPTSAALVRRLRRRAVGLRTSSFPSSTILRPCAFA